MTGLYVNNDVTVVGPFTALVPAWVDNLITDLHSVFWQAPLGAIALHVVTVIAYWAVKGQNLVPPPMMAQQTRALLLFACGGGVAAAALVNFL